MNQTQYDVSALSGFQTGVQSEFQPNHASAYQIALNAEVDAVERYKHNPSAQLDVVRARVAGGLLVELYARRNRFGDVAASSVVRDLTSANRSERGVYELGQYYQDKVIRAFRTTKHPYPPPSSQPSRPPFDTLETQIINNIDASGSSYTSTRKQALARDGYACVVTGMWNMNSLLKNAALFEKAKASGRFASGAVVTCHILNEASMQGIDPSETSEDQTTENKTRNTASMLAILHTFGLETLVSEFSKKNGVHTVKNVISLEPNVHAAFDSLRLWFEETDKEHVYTLGSSPMGESTLNNFQSINRRINFQRHISTCDLRKVKTRPEELLPDPALLALHAACACVAHMSGAAEVFDMMGLDDTEDIQVLAEDGSTGDVLYHMLAPYRDIQVA